MAAKTAAVTIEPGDAVADEPGTDGAVLDLERWYPFHCSVIANRVSACLESMYSTRYGLSVTGWRVMAHLGRHAPLSARALADHAAMSQLQITRAVDHLVEVGLVSRRVDTRDRRRVVLKLTRKGLNAYQQVVPVANGIEAALLEALTEDERERLLDFSARVLARAEDILADGCDWRRFRKDASP